MRSNGHTEGREHSHSRRIITGRTSFWNGHRRNTFRRRREKHAWQCGQFRLLSQVDKMWTTSTTGKWKRATARPATGSENSSPPCSRHCCKENTCHQQAKKKNPEGGQCESLKASNDKKAFKKQCICIRKKKPMLVDQLERTPISGGWAL